MGDEPEAETAWVVRSEEHDAHSGLGVVENGAGIFLMAAGKSERYMHSNVEEGEHSSPKGVRGPPSFLGP